MHIAGMKQESSRRSPLDTTIACKRCSSLGSVVFTCTASCRIGGIAGRGREDEAAELLQQGLHLTFHGCGGSRAVFISYRLQQLVETSVGVTKVQMAEDTRQRS